MQRALLAIDRISAWVGKTFAWSILALTLVIAYEVFARYVFRAPTGWGYDASYMLYGTLFMMAGAYAATSSTAASRRALRPHSTLLFICCSSYRGWRR
jgi:TRAP-type mannitol/chloroaromatic compound transport system permease small subunit